MTGPMERLAASMIPAPVGVLALNSVCAQGAEPPLSRICTLALPPSAGGPLIVTVRDEGRIAGMYVVGPGIPAFVGRAEAGPMTLSWTSQNGKPVTRQVEVLDEGSRFELKP